MLLYNSQVSGNCYKVRLLCAHLGLEFEKVELDVVDRSNRPEALGDLNPALRVPTLVLDNGHAMFESNAIIDFLAHDTPYLPTDRYEFQAALGGSSSSSTRSSPTSPSPGSSSCSINRSPTDA